MNVLITGVAGFLGSHLADKMIEKGHVVYGIDDLSGGYLENVNKKVIFYKGDCNNLDLMNAITKDIDLVYHCAADAHEGLSVFTPYFTSKNTFLTTSSVLSASIKNKVKRFVFCSSMARYGENKIPFTEDMEPRPQEPYGISKYASELLVRNMAEVHDMEYVIIVPHNIIGPRQKYDDPYRNVASIFINRMLQGKQPIIYGDGLQKRTFSYIEDVIDPLYEVAFRDVSGEVINIGPDEEFITIKTLAEIIAELLNFDLDPIYVHRRPQEVKYATCSADKARKLLDYNPKWTLKDGLVKMIEYIKECGVKSFDYHIDLEIINQKTPVTWRGKLI